MRAILAVLVALSMTGCATYGGQVKGPEKTISPQDVRSCPEIPEDSLENMGLLAKAYRNLLKAYKICDALNDEKAEFIKRAAEPAKK
jgi:PBP1b-binding outer membrane lipoprotein LpoB